MRLSIDSNEVKQILEMHSKLRKKRLLEQTEEPKIEEPKKEEVVVSQDEIDRKLIDDAISAGCLKNGKIRFLKGTKKPVYQATTLKSNQVVIFSPDMTYKFPATGETGKWKCSKAEQLKTQQSELKAQQDAQKNKETQLTTDAKNKKDAYILKFTGTPYNYLFNIPDIEKQKYTELDPVNDLRVPAGVFAVTDKFYSNPSLNKDIKGSSDSALDDVLENQSINRNACRKNIEDYYKSYKRRNSIKIDAPKFNKAKMIVQSCKDEHYGKWGILGGGKNYDKILDIMSGGSGGPLSYGETVIWLLK